MRVISILTSLSCAAAVSPPMGPVTTPYKAKAVKPGNWSLKPEQKWSPGNSSHFRHRHPPVSRADSSPGCYGGAWPYFATQKDMWNTPWGDYLVMVYGELPYDDAFPLCMGDFWMFWDELLKKAGVTDIPEFAGLCPPQSTIYNVDGQRIWRNNAYDPTNNGGDPGSVSWVWHPWGMGNPTVNNWPWYGANTPAEGGMSDNLWVEVTHKRDPWADESYGMWFLYARGSGIWLNLGKTIAFEGHYQAAAWLGMGDWPPCDANVKKVPDCLKHPGDLEMAKALRKKGYDSVQFYHHHDYAQYWQCQGDYTDPQQKFDMANMNIEIVSTGIVGAHSCGVKDDSHGALPGIGSGWYGQKWCGCNNEYMWTWCSGHGSQSQTPDDWKKEDPLHYDAYPCAPGERWSMISEKIGKQLKDIGCACNGPFTMRSKDTGKLMCYQNPPDFFAVVPVPNIRDVSTGNWFCSLQCSTDDDCGVDGQFCFHTKDGSASTCVWNLLPDGTCDVQFNGTRVNASRVVYVHQASQYQAATTADVVIV